MGTYENNQAADFLLGRLSEEERARFEESFVTDKQVYEDLLDTENQLIDDFVAGRMPAADMQSFEAAVAANPRQRHKVAFSRALLSYSEKALVTEPTARRSSFSEWFAGIFSLQPAFAMAAAAILLVVFAGVILFTGTNEPQMTARTSPQAAQPASRSIEPRPSEPSPSEPLSNSAAEAANGPTTPETRRTSPVSKPTVPTRKSVETDQAAPSVMSMIVTIILRPGLTRSEGESQAITGAKKSGMIRLQMEPKADGRSFRTYAVIVETVSGEQVWNRKLPATSKFVNANVPARLLPKGDYIVTLKGVDRSGLAETVDEYAFSVR